MTTSTEITVRTADEQDWRNLLLLHEVGFGTPYTSEAVDARRELVGIDRSIIAVDDEAVVGVTMDFPMTVTVPGEVAVRAAGITGVSVAPSHRRRGILRTLYTEQHRRIRATGAVLSVLIASEGGIYGRFGYGPATIESTVSVDRRLGAFHPKAPDPGGVRVLRPTDARAAITAVYDRWQRITPGAQVRPDILWDQLFADHDIDRGGGTSLFAMLHDDGYALYRRAGGEDAMIARIQEMRTVTDDAHAALWRALFGLDLMHGIETTLAPEDPLPQLLTDSRVVRTRSRHDRLWVRIMDVRAALEARTYRSDLDLVLQVDDGFLHAGGCFRLTARDGHATCTPTDDTPQVVADLDVLGSLYLGAHRARTFAAAHRLWADTPETLWAVDHAFDSNRSAQIGWPF
ncbi:GNAT family N-acetyltransferase [Rhodococcus sp. WMMA185]|uniref:enhanced intracellular survival protein Eis n=1 Tax=Rhodococcus sp. WMMA185 TaxID=679318 RepID=UPI000877F44F|nr:enhanced intracellular survival protein Eis [Rhodococcus sp. WMMA185]AOW92824.1 GNAT family N-acetyltransferase [Rhodococcus sp. WMMA185]